MKPHQSINTALGALAGVAACAALAACGSASGSPNSTQASASDNALKFSQCMREHGIKNFPNPEVSGSKVTLRLKAGPGAPSPQTLEAAQNACKHFMASSQPNLTPQERVAREEQVQKFAKCMREHGIKIEAHTAGNGGGFEARVGPAGGGGPNPESPSFQAAQKACQGLLPAPKGGPGGGPTTDRAPGGAQGSGGGPTLGIGG